MHAWLATRDPARAAALAPGDRYRVTRALEIALAAPAAGVASAASTSLRAAGIEYVKIVLDVDPATLDALIATRVDAMLEAGLLAEAERIGPGAVAADAVGYPQALAYLAGFSTESELREALARATRRYAKRQRTWFRAEPGARRTAPSDVEALVVAQLGW